MSISMSATIFSAWVCCMSTVSMESTWDLSAGTEAEIARGATAARTGLLDWDKGAGLPWARGCACEEEGGPPRCLTPG